MSRAQDVLFLAAIVTLAEYGRLLAAVQADLCEAVVLMAQGEVPPLSPPLGPAHREAPGSIGRQGSCVPHTPRNCPHCVPNPSRYPVEAQRGQVDRWVRTQRVRT